MKTLDFYRLKENSIEKAFDSFLSNLKQTINSYSYFVDMDKVISNCVEKKEILLDLEMALKLEDPKESLEEFKKVAKKYKKDFIKTLLSLVAIRKKSIAIKKSGYLQVCERKLKGADLSFRKFYLEWPDDDKKIDTFLKDWYFFLKETQLISMVKENKISLVDYMFGLEVGINTNARKNRGGSRMEEIVRFYIEKLDLKDIVLLQQKTYGSSIPNCPKNISRRKADFVLKTKTNTWIIEANYFASCGSKVYKTIEDFLSVFHYIKDLKNGTNFLWITDGFGWKGAKSPFFQAFVEIDYILNIHMLEKGYLRSIIKN